MRKQNKTKNILLFFCYAISLIGLLFSGYHLIILNQHTKNNNGLKEQMNKNILYEEKDSNVTNKFDKYIIDWDYFIKKNDDSVAYLNVKNTNIQYIIVQGEDNAYYLKHNFNREFNVTGWVFLDYRNNIDGDDNNTIIYGHNVYDNSMFGSLKNVLKKEWYTDDKNLKIDLVTKERLQTYQIFSIYTVNKEDYYLQIKFDTNNQFETFLETIKNRSIYNFNIDVNGNDKILTLSTCTNGSKSRIVVHAKLLND